MDFELAKRYFNPLRRSKVRSLPFFIPGSVCVLFGLTLLPFLPERDVEMIICIVFLIASIVLLIVGIAVIASISRYNKEAELHDVSDQEYDQMIDRFLLQLRNTRAMQVLGIDASEVQEIRPLIFGGYKILGANRFKRGKDGLYRTDVYEAVIIYFSANDVHCYTCNFHTTEPNMTEATDVYFYRDIVSVSTMQETEKIGASVQQTQKFVLTTTGGTRLSVSLTQREDTDRSINAMRSLLREKKQSMA